MKNKNIKKILKIAILVIFIIVVVRFDITIFEGIMSDGSGGCTAPGLSQEQIDTYNKIAQKYIGDSVKGSEVRLMIEELIVQNTENVNESGKFISIHNGTKEKRENKASMFSDSNDELLDSACKNANIYENIEEGNNTEENIEEASKIMREFSKSLNPGEYYKVEPEKAYDGIIYAIYISKIDKGE